MLKIAGPYEILPWSGGDKPPRKEALPALARAYSLLGYDLGCLTPDEAAALAAQNAPAPKGWLTLGKEPQAKTAEVGGLKVGVLFLPLLGQDEKTPDKKLVAKVSRAAKRLREDADVVIGVSPWGMRGEEALLKKRPGLFDVLLGAGRGSGLYAKAPNGETVYTRAYEKGKAINRIDLLELPKGEKHVWSLQKNFKAKITPLDDATPDNGRIKALFRK